MCRTWAVAIALCLAALVRGGARADEPKDAAALLDRAIQAAGGLEKLAKVRAVTLKVQGKLYDDEKEKPFTGEWAFQGLKQSRSVNVTDDDGTKSREVRVINGDKGWSQTDKEAAEELDEDTLADEKEELYRHEITRLAPLKDKAYTLALAGGGKMGGHETIGLKVSRAGCKDIKLFFDKKNYLLVKTERYVRDSDLGNYVAKEVFFSDYKEVEGTQQPMKMVWKTGGETNYDLEIVEIKLLDKLDEKLFTKP
jgi:hypothetical protein